MNRPKVYSERQISLSRTPQELAATGSTFIGPNKQDMNWYMPQGLASGELTLQQVREIRESSSIMTSTIMGQALGVSNPIAFGLAEINDRGETINDPRIIGVIDEESGQLDGSQANELAVHFYKLCAEVGVDLHQRVKSDVTEQEYQGAENKG